MIVIDVSPISDSWGLADLQTQLLQTKTNLLLLPGTVSNTSAIDPAHNNLHSHLVCVLYACPILAGLTSALLRYEFHTPSRTLFFVPDDVGLYVTLQSALN